MSKKKTNNKKTQVSDFKEFTLTLPDHDEPVVVPVVASMDDLPRSQRRRLRNVMTDSGADQVVNNGPKFQVGVDYALAYAASQGVHINLDSIEDDAAYNAVRMELLTAGLRLIGHFAGVQVDAGKATRNDEDVAAEA